MEKRKKEISEIIGGLGMPAMKYAEYLKELVIKIVREHPETDMNDIHVSTDDNGCICLVYERYMTDEELAQRDAKLKKLQEEVEASGLLDDNNDEEQPH
jgi:hypothetical protein